MTAIIGIDCATQPNLTGLVYARPTPTGLTILAAAIGSTDQRPSQIVSSWLLNEPSALLALDAPLGWPESLGPALVGHHAGDELPVEANVLFRRVTDDAIHERLRKRPLDVGADRIARTARAALRLLHELRGLTKQQIPLAWTTGPVGGIEAIEVYPAATRAGRGVPSGRGSLAGFESEITLAPGVELPESVDVRDAVICAVGGADFLSGRAIPPTDVVRARREGWIWACEAATATRPDG